MMDLAVSSQENFFQSCDGCVQPGAVCSHPERSAGLAANASPASSRRAMLTAVTHRRGRGNQWSGQGVALPALTRARDYKLKNIVWGRLYFKDMVYVWGVFWWRGDGG